MSQLTARAPNKGLHSRMFRPLAFLSYIALLQHVMATSPDGLAAPHEPAPSYCLACTKTACCLRLTPAAAKSYRQLEHLTPRTIECPSSHFSTTPAHPTCMAPTQSQAHQSFRQSSHLLDQLSLQLPIAACLAPVPRLPHQFQLKPSSLPFFCSNQLQPGCPCPCKQAVQSLFAQAHTLRLPHQQAAPYDQLSPYMLVCPPS